MGHCDPTVMHDDDSSPVTGTGTCFPCLLPKGACVQSAAPGAGRSHPDGCEATGSPGSA
jgi:hypothetical protein